MSQDQKYQPRSKEAGTGTMELRAKCLVAGTAAGPLLFSDEPLSFWGGINPATGKIIDRHHPLSGKRLKDHVFAMPCGRGSCTGSVAMLELLLNGQGPVAMIFQRREEILTLGVIVAKMLFQRHIPVIVLKDEDFHALQRYGFAAISGDCLSVSNEPDVKITKVPREPDLSTQVLELSSQDQAILEGSQGKAARTAMKILVEFASIQGAKALVDVTQVHIDACIWVAPASTRFAEHFADLGDAKFAVPASMNSISNDRQRWQVLGVDPDFAREADRLASAYVKMGASPSFTCAPYLLDTAPKSGEQVGWGESNAVVFANSVLGACTQKYPDFIDVCIALSGRAPAAGVHIPENRRPSIRIEVPKLDDVDDLLFPLLGYCAGHHSGAKIPFIVGMEHTNPSIADLKAFGAAFATTSSAPMFHICNVTKEASKMKDHADQLPAIKIEYEQLEKCWRSLNTATDSALDLVALGNPHFAYEEFESLLNLCRDRRKHPDVSFVVTTSRHIYGQIAKAGMIEPLEEFGVQILSDTCWYADAQYFPSSITANIVSSGA